MIFTGSLAVIIDGLNEVSAEARGKILEFFKRNARDGNILVSTQPLEWGDRTARRYQARASWSCYRSTVSVWEVFS
jgi:hypothetical protein